MAEIIRKFDNKNKAILPGGSGVTPMTHFNLIKLKEGEEIEYQLDGYELVFVMLSGECDIQIDDIMFSNLKRTDIWTDKPDSVYVPSGGKVKISGVLRDTEIAVGGMICNEKYKPFRIRPEEVKAVEVGASESKNYRSINYILQKTDENKFGNIIINELYAEEGCWSAYPPHKHDMENVPVESEFEEIYHYRFKPENGFGGQFVFFDNGKSECYMVKNGDSVLIDKGYHPTVYAPGHTGYMFVILSGKYNDVLIQNFKDEYAYLKEGVPGVQDMLNSYQKK